VAYRFDGIRRWRLVLDEIYNDVREIYVENYSITDFFLYINLSEVKNHHISVLGCYTRMSKSL
jgi:hypothetical protein